MERSLILKDLDVKYFGMCELAESPIVPVADPPRENSLMLRLCVKNVGVLSTPRGLHFVKSLLRSG